MERLLPKARILELYLNAIEWGERCYGAEAAARFYFGHSAQALTDRESAILAAMIARDADPAAHGEVSRRYGAILAYFPSGFRPRNLKQQEIER